MARILIVGDSQAQGTPGSYAESKFRALGHTTQRLAQQGCGAIDWSGRPSANCPPDLWQRYNNALNTFRPDVVVLIFGSNDAGSGLAAGLQRLKNATPAPVWMSGPPMYPTAERQRLGETIKATNREVFGGRWIDAYPATPLTLPRDALQAHLPGAAGRPWGELIADSVIAGMASGGAVRLPFGGGRSVDVLTIAAGVVGVAAVGAFAFALLRRR